MKRSKPLKRVPFRRQRKDGPTVAQPSAEWNELPRNTERPRVSTVKPITMGTYARTSTVARPKSEPKRCPALLAMARGKRCLLVVPGICTNDTATTVACHSNLSIHGKAGARKADDHWTAWGCMACHRWLDQGQAKADVKALAFTLAHLSQVQEWRKTAGDAGAPARERRAARWALDQLKETTCE